MVFSYLWAVAALGASLLAQPTSATTLTVATTSDTINGDTSSPTALIADPGPDGISLREALVAVNNAAGPHTITFAQALAGQAIIPGTDYPTITQDGVAIAGLVTGGQPTPTIDASGVFTLFRIRASNVTLSSLRIIGLQSSSPGGKFGVQVNGGQVGGTLGPQRVTNVVLRGNTFSNNLGVSSGVAISLGTDPQAVGALVSNVTIADNSFSHITLADVDAIRVASSGMNNTVQDVMISGNVFSDVQFPVELVPYSGSGNRIVRTRVIGNTFQNNTQAVNLNHIGNDNQPVTTGNLIDDTLIARNVFRSGPNPAITILGGLTEPGDQTQAVANTINNTRIENNVITGGTAFPGISIVGGRQGSANNVVQNIMMVGNTIANNPGTTSAIVAVANLNGGAGNGVSSISVSDTILWNNTPSDFGGITPDQVRNSITCQAGFAGVNNNICADPQFVNAGSGDFHLQPGSPAVGAGTHSGAPFGDLECKVRSNPPAIGAYEPGNNPSCTLITPLSAVLPSSRSVQVGNLASAFASITNPGSVTGKACGLRPATSLPASFIFQTTDPATNQLSGTPNTPVDIAAGATQTFVFGFTLSAAFTPVEAALEFTCADTLDAPTHVGLNTLLVSASATPVPDLVAIGITPSKDGIVNIPGTTGTGVFATAAVNIGAGATITATGDDGGSGLPVNLSVCQTDPSTGQCINPTTPGTSATVSVSQNETVTFTVFTTGTANVPFDPANNRLFLRLKDAGGFTRGATSVAVRTQ